MTHPIAGAHPPPGRPREEALLDGLTPEQAQAVQHGPGPLLLIAGPGAGKTKTLIHRIARLLADRRGAAVGDPRGHVLGARGRRAATAARRSARRAGRARRHRGHVSLHLRADAQRARRRVRPHRELHRLRPGRRAPRDRMAALRSAARADPTGARRPRAARRQPRCSPRSRWRRTGCCPPTATSRHARHAAAPLIAAVWRELEVELQRSNSLDFDDLLDARGAAAGRAPAPARVLPPTLAMAASSTSTRTPTRPRASWSPCWREPEATSAASRTTTSSSTAGAGRGAAEHPRVRRAVPRACADRARP